MNYDTIRYDEEGRIGIITFSRPERLNAMNEQFFNEFGMLLDEIEREDVRVLC